MHKIAASRLKHTNIRQMKGEHITTANKARSFAYAHLILSLLQLFCLEYFMETNAIETSDDFVCKLIHNSSKKLCLLL